MARTTTGRRGMPTGWSTCPSCQRCSAAKPVPSELVYLLVSLDKQYTAEQPGEPWEAFYARHIIEHFEPAS